MSTRCYLGLGSNLKTPKRQIRNALYALKKLPKTVLIQTSKLESTKPLGLGYQPQYCNTVVELQTKLSPKALHQYCIQIEEKQKRVRKKRWASRTLDIDLLIYGTRKIRSKRLIIPHPRILERTFVHKPLFELNPMLEKSLNHQ